MLTRRALSLFSIFTVMAGPLIAFEEVIKLRDLYKKNLTFSDLALKLEGHRIKVSGFMAPPLKAETNFFVLTKMPMSVCPFCETEADWPDDILVVHTKRIVRVLPFNLKIEVQGVLELGTAKDAETGFVSRVRLIDATYN